MATPGPMVARYCTRCGRDRVDGARFCTGCGLGFADAAPAEPLRIVEEIRPERPFPVALLLPYQPQRRRLTTLLRLPLALPHIALALLLVASSLVVAVAGWLCAILLGRLPGPIHRFQARVLAYVWRVAAYLWLASAAWPAFPWQAQRPGAATVLVDPPGRLPRVRTLLICVLSLPSVVTSALFGIVIVTLSIGAWCAILATGRMPRSIHDMLDLALSFQCRTAGYIPLLLTGVYPWYESGDLVLPSRRAGG